jgi:hypothetical protein
MNIFPPKPGWLCVIILFMGIHAGAQQVPAITHPAPGHRMQGSHRLSLGLGHTHLSQGEIAGRTEWVPIASWTLNYDYWLNDKWAIGLQNDWILETFIVKGRSSNEIERKRPWAMVPVALYKVSKNFTALGGVGAEFSHGHTLAMTRLGLEYGLHLPQNFEVGLAAVWDGKWGYYNSWGLAFTFSKIWPKKQKH